MTTGGALVGEGEGVVVGADELVGAGVMVRLSSSTWTEDWIPCVKLYIVKAVLYAVLVFALVKLEIIEVIFDVLLKLPTNSEFWKLLEEAIIMLLFNF